MATPATQSLKVRETCCGHGDQEGGILTGLYSAWSQVMVQSARYDVALRVEETSILTMIRHVS